MVAARYPKVLYFLVGMNPTDDDIKAAAEYGPGVVFRNGSQYHDGEPLENCAQAVGPCVPKAYKEAFNAKAGAAKSARADEVSRGANATSKVTTGEVVVDQPTRNSGGWGTGRGTAGK